MTPMVLNACFPISFAQLFNDRNFISLLPTYNQFLNLFKENSSFRVLSVEKKKRVLAEMNDHLCQFGFVCHRCQFTQHPLLRKKESRTTLHHLSRQFEKEQKREIEHTKMIEQEQKRKCQRKTDRQLCRLFCMTAKQLHH